MFITTTWLQPGAVAFAAALTLLSGGVQAKQAPVLDGAVFANLPDRLPTAGGPPLVVYDFDVSGILSFDELNDVDNVLRTINVGSASRVVGIGWDVTLFADSPSWRSEVAVMFGSSSWQFVSLRPAVGDDEPGTASYSSGGIVDLVGLGFDFSVNGDGQLKMEFFETFDDFEDDWDGEWESGTLSIQVQQIPEPSTYALMALGVAGVGAMVRRRKST